MIEVRDYDPAWPVRFEALREEYAAALAGAGVPVLAIEHVGSTAVPGLAAKPVIDVDIVVADTDVAAASEVLVGLGFEARGEVGIPQRRAFYEPDRLAAAGLPDQERVAIDGNRVPMTQRPRRPKAEAERDACE